MFGGGVYSFSYLVLGPTISFVAVSSIMVDYILTAQIQFAKLHTKRFSSKSRRALFQF